MTGKNFEEIEEQLHIILPKKPDLIELRADFLSDISDTYDVIKIVKNILNQTNIPLLFTIRSSREGGEVISLDEAEVLALLKEICNQTNVYMIDYELNNSHEDIKKLLRYAKKSGKQVILSHHNFNQTPEEKDLIAKLLLMEELGADHAKIAVMPNSREDVFRLLDLTLKMSAQLKIPLTTMSMGDQGKLSRSLGWIYGSNITFAVGAKSSAPGQIEIETLRKGINEIAKVI